MYGRSSEAGPKNKAKWGPGRGACGKTRRRSRRRVRRGHQKKKKEGVRTPPSRSSAAPTSNGSSLLSSKRASSSRRSTGGGNDDGEAAHVVRQPGEGRRAREISPMRRPDDAGPLPDEVPVEEIAAMVERQVSSKSFEPASSGM